MNMRMLSVFSLLLAVNAINCDNKQYRDAYLLASLKRDGAESDARGKLRELNRIAYEQIYKAWDECLQNAEDYETKTACNKRFKRKQINIVKRLKGTPEYDKFDIALFNTICFSTEATGLLYILAASRRYPLSNSTQEERIQELHNAINYVGSYPDDVSANPMILKWTKDEDMREAEEKARDILHSLVDKIEENNQ